MMIFISGVIGIIILKITICTNKNRAIYFCPNDVIFYSKILFFLFVLATASLPLPPPPARAPISKP